MTSVHVQRDEEEIRQLMDRWRRSTEADDLDGVLALMTDDAVFLTCGNPPMDKAQFAQGFRSLAGRVRIEPRQDIREIRVSGQLAYAWSHLSVAMIAEDGHRTERAGHVLTVFRKSDGKWLLCRDANFLASF